MWMVRGGAGSLLACAMLLTMTPRAEACSCAWSGSFVRMAAGSEVVIRGVVRDYRNGPQGFPQAMVVEVVEVLKGSLPGHRVVVWGDNGAQCRPYVTAFPVGTEWVFALHRERRLAIPGQYVISICGEFSLRVSGSDVVGKVTSDDPTGRDQTVPLARLRELLRSRS